MRQGGSEMSPWVSNVAPPWNAGIPPSAAASRAQPRKTAVLRSLAADFRRFQKGRNMEYERGTDERSMAKMSKYGNVLQFPAIVAKFGALQTARSAIFQKDSKRYRKILKSCSFIPELFADTADVLIRCGS